MAGDYLRRVIADGACERVGADGLGLLAFLAIQPQPVALSREELGRRAGLSKRKVIEVVRVAVAAGWLLEVAGSGRAAGALTCVGLGVVVSETTRVVSVGASSGDVLPFPPPLAPPVVVEPVPEPAPAPPAAQDPDVFALACEPTPKRKRKPATPKVAAIPPELAGDVFGEAWERWKRYRAERRAALTPSTEALQLKKLAAVGVAAAVWAIDESIGHGWQGLFPEKFNEQGSNNGTRANATTRAGRVVRGRRVNDY